MIVMAAVAFSSHGCRVRGTLHEFSRLPPESIVWVHAKLAPGESASVARMIEEELANDGQRVITEDSLDSIDQAKFNLAIVVGISSGPLLVRMLPTSEIAIDINGITFGERRIGGHDLAIAAAQVNPSGKMTLLLAAQHTEDLLTVRFAHGCDFVVYDHIGPYVIGSFKANTLAICRSTFVRRPNWQTLESAHFLIRYTAAMRAEEAIAISRTDEAALAQTAKFLDTTVVQKITHYVYPSSETKGRVTGDFGNAHSKPWYNELHSVYSDEVKAIGAHEITHIVANQLNIPPAFIGEGLAVWMDRTWGGEELTVRLRKLAEKGAPIAPESILTTAAFQSTPQEESYVTAGSLVGFLIDEYGKDRFLCLYRTCSYFDSYDRISGHFNAIYGKSFGDLVGEWRAITLPGS